MSETGRGRGRPAFEATDADRKKVASLAAVGLAQADIAREIGCSEKTLRAAFRTELDAGAARANAAVAGALYATAVDRKHPKHVIAAIFWLKARAGWREAQPNDPPPPLPTEPPPTEAPDADPWGNLLEKPGIMVN